MGLTYRLRQWLFLLCQSRSGQCLAAPLPHPGPLPEGEGANALQPGQPRL